MIEFWSKKGQKTVFLVVTSEGVVAAARVSEELTTGIGVYGPELAARGLQLGVCGLGLGGLRPRSLHFLFASQLHIKKGKRFWSFRSKLTAVNTEFLGRKPYFGALFDLIFEIFLRFWIDI